MTGEDALILARGYVDSSLDGLGAVKGSPCTIKQIADIDGGHCITFEWVGSSGTTETTSIDVKDGVDGASGKDGLPGTDGQPGKDGLNGKDGKNGADGADGEPGQDGFSPTIRIETVTGGHKVTVTDINGSDSFVVKNGEPFTYDKFTADQLAALKGEDGLSPTVTITEATGMHTVSFNDKDGVKSFVVKDGSALDVANYYTKDEVDAALIMKANKDAIPAVPTNLSELNNDENYIKNTVDNLVNYYIKSDVYTKTEVNGLISNIQKLTSQIVEHLPTEDIDTSVIYLIKQADTAAYMQYMYINNSWAELGSTQVDLSNLYSRTAVDAKLREKADKSEIPTVPNAVSAFTNDAGYLTEYTETDPTVPAWAKAATKPSYTAAEVHALPDDTEIPVFTNKTVLDGITTEKVSDWDESVKTVHSHENKNILDKFTEAEDGNVLYDGERIASGNLWHGTKAEYDALDEKDVSTTYVVTDEDNDVASALVDDDTVSSQCTWSSKKINDTLIFKNTKKLNKGASSSTGTTEFTFDLSTLSLPHGYYHFKCYVLGNANLSYFAEGGIGQYDGDYRISIDYQSSHIKDISVSGTVITITTTANYYIAGVSIQSVDDWMVS